MYELRITIYDLRFPKLDSGYLMRDGELHRKSNCTKGHKESQSFTKESPKVGKSESPEVKE